ncbi:hypothetical protein COS79_04190 [Candidatus Woesearchaeota archaeon CG06_land_8_20_14_3_00_33_13]|nr:MAG: hypothetical protein COS79_04190 [Candidatus Woesearchaeota archaeon CG06_land_8_20_14_3_00_33_13]
MNQLVENILTVELKESQTVELKESLSQLDDALKSVCAFLNHKGGTVYFGVDDKGMIIGLEVSDKTFNSKRFEEKT